MEQEEYELIPMNPIRKMEKRMEKIEQGSGGMNTIKELVEIVKINQQVVDDIVKINSEIVNKVTNLSSSVDNLSNKIQDFMDRIEIAGEEASEGKEDDRAGVEIEHKVDERLSKIEKRINALILSRVPKEKWKSMKTRRPAPKPSSGF